MSGGWEKISKLDDLVFRAYNLYQELKLSVPGCRKKLGLLENAALSGRGKGRRCFIVGNGPSIQSQDMTLLKDEETFFCNYFFRHPQIREIQPSFHAIVDQKLVTGEWPLTMLDEVIAACPEITLLLNAEWKQNSEIAAYAEKAQVYWVYSAKFLYPGFSYRIDLTRNCLGGNVVLANLSTAIYMGFDPIYLLGVDLNGLFHDLLDSSSHFYGGAAENAAKEPYKMEMDLRSTAHGFRQWRALAKRFEAGSPQIVNLTEGGLLNVFPREDYETVLLNVKSQSIVV